MGISWILGELLDTASGKGNYSIMELLWISWGVALFFLLASFLNYYAKPRYVKKAMQNYKEDDNNYRKENYIAIPVLFNYGIELVDGIKVVPYLGPTFSYGISGVVAGGATAFGITVSTGEVNLYGDNSTYAPFDILVGGGVALDVMDMVRAYVGYNIGLLDRNTSDNAVLKASGVNFGVAYLF